MLKKKSPASRPDNTAINSNGKQRVVSKHSPKSSNKTPTKGRRESGANTNNTSKKSKSDVDMLPRPHIEEAVATRLLRDSYTRERHYFLMRIIVVVVLALIVSTVGNIMMASKPVEYRYFATDSEGRIKELTPLNNPVQSVNAMLNWTVNSITQTYTFSFANYRQELQAAQSNFTPGGWQGFERALESSRILATVIENRYVTTAVPTGAPVIVAEGLTNGRYAWRIQVPITVTYQSAARQTSQSLLVTVTIVRRPETEHPVGLGIAQIIAE